MDRTPTDNVEVRSSEDPAAWTTITDDDALWAPPATFPPPIADPAPLLLNTHEMPWESFERLILAMARRLDGAYDVRRYGIPGQAQHGLDVVAFLAGRATCVYQAKQRKKFDQADLAAAVNLYSEGRRPFDAKRVVIAVAIEIRDTATLEKLAELRQADEEMEIELWDRQSISDQLRTERNLVTTFFGAPTAAAFCATTPPTAVPPSGPSITADAILRGPIAHLGRGDDLRRAQDALRDQPAEAVALLSQIAGELEAVGFVPHAAPVRELQARALRATGSRTDEARLRLDLGWRHLHAGDTFSAGVQVGSIAELADDLPDDIVRSANALSVSAGIRREYAVTLDQLAEAVDALSNGDAHRADAALVLAEEAVAARRPTLVASRADLLGNLAASMPLTDQGQLTAARLRMCLADCCGGWNELVSTARDAFPPAVTALVLARHARHLALIPQAEPSIARWRDAVERACLTELNDDAADWLYALRAVRVQNGLLTDDISDLHRHAQALRAAGSGSVLPEPYRARERGLAALQDQKWPDALEALHRYVWRTVIGADWAGELDAHELLGDLLLRTGRGYEAVKHYVNAGQSTKLVQVAEGLRDEPLHLAGDLLTPRPWERVSAFVFVAACADLLVDDDARQWCNAAFGEFVDHKQPAPSLGPDPWIAAFRAFCELSEVSTSEQASQFLEIGRALVPREPNRFRHTDEAHAKALISIARTHRDLRANAIEQLLALLLLDQSMAEQALANAQDLLADDPARTLAIVGGAAAEGNYYAALAVVAAGGDTTLAEPVARQRVQSSLAPREHQPGRLNFGTALPQASAFASVLPEDERTLFARGMMDFADDVEEVAPNRCDALLALRGIARRLSDDVRDELFQRVLPYAEGQITAPPGRNLLLGADDPLQRFRIALPNEPLAPAGLMAASALARTREQYALVERVAIAQLRGASGQTENFVAHALTSIPPDDLTLPVELLAGHPSEWLRSVAAVVWAHRRDASDAVGLALARDPSRHVRTSLSGSLGGDPRHTAVRAVFAEDPRRSVRRRAGNLDA